MGVWRAISRGVNNGDMCFLFCLTLLISYFRDDLACLFMCSDCRLLFKQEMELLILHMSMYIRVSLKNKKFRFDLAILHMAVYIPQEPPKKV